MVNVLRCCFILVNQHEQELVRCEEDLRMVMKAWTGAALEPSSVNDLPERRTRLIAEVLRVERLADQLLISIDELDLKLLPATRASISGAAFVGIASESENRITATRERKRSVVQRLNALLEKLIPGVITQLNSPALPGGSCGASRAVSSQELFSSEGVGEIRDRKPVESPQRFPVRAPQGNESVEEVCRRARVRACFRACMCACIRACIRACECVCMRPCVRACVRIRV